MFSVYAKSADGRTLKGTSDVESAAEALTRLHKLADAKGIAIVKATVRKLDDGASFKISDAPDADGAPKAAAKKGTKR